MFTIYMFAISGIVLVILVVSKRLEERKGHSVLVLSLISKSDVYARDLYHRAVHIYSNSREDLTFLWEKQIPKHSRNALNKLSSYLKERQSEYLENLRDSRILKKSDGISEFFQKISNIDKGNGTIHEDIEDGSQIEEKQVN